MKPSLLLIALLCALFVGCKSNAAKDQAFSCARG
jgi:hypothetical protein